MIENELKIRDKLKRVMERTIVEVQESNYNTDMFIGNETTKAMANAAFEVLRATHEIQKFLLDQGIYKEK